MRWCRCCWRGNDNTGSIQRYYNIQAVADDQSVSQANWSPVVVEGLPYLYNWLTSDTEAFVIMQPLRFTVINSNVNGAVIDIGFNDSQVHEFLNSGELPEGSHIGGGPVSQIHCPAFSESHISYQGQIPDLHGEITTSPGNSGNLGQNPPAPYAHKKGARPRYLRIWEDGVDVSGGLIDLDANNPAVVHPQFYWLVSDYVNFESLNHEFSLKQGKEYTFDLYIEMAVDGAGTLSSCGHVIREGQSVPFTATTFNAGIYTQVSVPLSRFSYMYFHGLPNNQGFNHEVDTYAIVEWEGGEFQPPLPLVLEETVGPNGVSGTIDLPVRGEDQPVLFQWHNELAFMEIPQTLTQRHPFIRYAPNDSNYAETTQSFKDGVVFDWGSQGLFNVDGETDLFPFSIKDEDLSGGLDPYYPTRIRIKKVRQTRVLVLTVSWTLTGWVAGETLTIHYDVRNPNKDEILNAYVQSTPHHTDLDDDERTISAKASERYTVEQLITEADISSGEINITAFATGSRPGGTKSSDPVEFTITGQGQ